MRSTVFFWNPKLKYSKINMSFSSNVKKEMITCEDGECCLFARNYALLLFGRAFSSSELSMLTENEEVINAYCSALSYFGLPDAEIRKSEAGNFSIVVTDTQRIARVMTAAGHSDKNAKRRINFAAIGNECCFSAFIRGAFLACGNVTDPEKEYHLEFSVPTKGLSDDLMKIFDEFEPTPKMTVRAGAYVVYLKSSSEIEDLLAIMGATENSLELMGAKMYKDVRNKINRKVNFENANLKRTIAASSRQYEAISYIAEHSGIDSLPEELRLLAALRLENRELSNSELAGMLPESISVSGINHRFRRMIDIAEKMKKDREK